MKKALIRAVCCLALAALAFLLPRGARAVSDPLPLQDCHRVTLTREDTTRDDKSVVRTWKVTTALSSVDA